MGSSFFAQLSKNTEKRTKSKKMKKENKNITIFVTRGCYK